jgi:hypothetical protein
MKELYSFAQPSIKWKDFKKECEEYSKKYKEWDDWKMKNIPHPEWEGKSITECIGPRPYEFYYLPKEIMKDICDLYVHTYRIDQQQELLDTIETLKNYCKEPIIDKYIDDWTDEAGHHPGYRSYDHPDNLKKEIEKILFGRMSEEAGEYREESAEILQNKFFEFLDMAGNFFNWNRDLNTFNCSVYLGPSPNSNKEAVIENWKLYRNKDIKINEEQMKKEYFGEDGLDD